MKSKVTKTGFVWQYLVWSERVYFGWRFEEIFR